MIVKKSDRFIVMDTVTKRVISEHEFTDSPASVKKAKSDAVASNDIWKSASV